MATNVALATKLVNYPEEIDDMGNKLYGETSFETRVAILSHYLHNLKGSTDDDRYSRAEIREYIRDYFLFKDKKNKNSEWEDWSDEDIDKVAESPLQTDLFSDFYQIPFPDPKKPKFTFIDLFAGIGGLESPCNP